MLLPVVPVRDARFRQHLAELASDAMVVRAFNRTHKRDLLCPIAPLVNPIYPLMLREEEVHSIALFVAWVYVTSWRSHAQHTSGEPRLALNRRCGL